MPSQDIFKSFFSYARHDADTDESLVSALSKTLEARVNGMLTNARFALWRDTVKLNTGALWENNIEKELQSSDILIVLLTPRWIDSKWCRKEYLLFEQIESERSVGPCVIPILAKSIERQIPHLTSDQHDVYNRLLRRHHKSLLATEFLRQSEAERTLQIEEIADDIAGIIERIRNYSAQEQRTPSKLPNPSGHREVNFVSPAHNYENVDIIGSAEVLIEPSGKNKDRALYAQVEFVEHLYIEGEQGRINFGIKRAFLSVANKGSGEILPADDLKRSSKNHNTHYVMLHANRDAVTICIDPPEGKASLGELALPPVSGENRLSKIATATAEVNYDDVGAQLMVALSAEGLAVTDHEGHILSKGLQDKIQAIMQAVLTREERNQDGFIHRRIPVRERS
jgi:hypothetical protein